MKDFSTISETEILKCCIFGLESMLSYNDCEIEWIIGMQKHKYNKEFESKHLEWLHKRNKTICEQLNELRGELNK
jgi:hypothetical protein